MKTKVVEYLIVSFLLGMSLEDAKATEINEVVVYDVASYTVYQSDGTIVMGDLIAPKKVGKLATDTETQPYKWSSFDVIRDADAGSGTTVTMDGFLVPTEDEQYIESESTIITTISWDSPLPRNPPPPSASALECLALWFYCTVHSLVEKDPDAIETYREWIENLNRDINQNINQQWGEWYEWSEEETLDALKHSSGEDAVHNIVGGESIPLEELLSGPLYAVTEPPPDGGGGGGGGGGGSGGGPAPAEPATMAILALGGLAVLRRRKAV